MKTIKLKDYQKVQKVYRVYLGNGTINSFQSVREVNYFLAATNNFLTDKLHDLHQQYIDVWNCFQENWFYFDNSLKTNKQSLYSMERACTSNLQSVLDKFNLSVQRCGFANGNYFVFIHFLGALELLEDTIRLLSGLYAKHSNTNAISKMDVYIRRAMYSRNEIENYGKRSSTRLFKIPTHISEHKTYIPELVELRVA